MLMFRSTHDAEVAMYRRKVEELLRFVSAARILAERHDAHMARIDQLERLLGMTAGQQTPEGESPEVTALKLELKNIEDMITLAKDSPALRMVDRSKKRNELDTLDRKRREIEGKIQKELSGVAEAVSA
jgi:prephenate dehydrogenase